MLSVDKIIFVQFLYLVLLVTEKKNSMKKKLK
jgi:hypothetical protein